MSTPSAFKSILFDLDGTLLDTAYDLTLALNKVVQHYNPEKEFSLQEARLLVRHGSEAIFHQLLTGYLPHVDFFEFRNAFREAYAKQASGYTVFFEGITPLLTELNARKISWGIVTNKTEAGAKQAAAHFTLLQTAHCIVGCDTANEAKPSAEPLLYACKKLAVLPTQCLFVGDTIIDMEAAHHAKLTALAVNYGYGTRDILNGKFPPFAWIQSPDEILNFI